MARTIGDVALLFATLSGQDSSDPASPPVSHGALSLEDAKRIPIGWFEDDGLVPVTSETRTAVREAARALQEHGFTVKPFRPKSLEAARRLWFTFFVHCGAMLYAPTIRGHKDELSPIFRDFLEIAHQHPPLTADSLLNAWVESDKIRAALLEEMREFPLLLCAVCSIPAFKPFDRSWTIEGQSVSYLDAMRYTQWFNLLGGPAAVVPVTRSAEGLPIGVQIAGRPWEDQLVLAVAAAVEAEFGYHPPPLAL
jgi:amidase